jgi:hypothetical protein
MSNKKNDRRKRKLKARAKNQLPNIMTPYDGERYQAVKWAFFTGSTEAAILSVAQAVGRDLTNEQVRLALISLGIRLRKGEPDPDLATVPEAERFSERIIRAIRAFWAVYVARVGLPVATSDQIGVLRTLLYSIQAHNWNTGAHRGYLAFLREEYPQLADTELETASPDQLRQFLEEGKFCRGYFDLFGGLGGRDPLSLIGASAQAEESADAEDEADDADWGDELHTESSTKEPDDKPQWPAPKRWWS